MEQVDQILSQIRATSGRWYEAELHRFRGELLCAHGDAAAAEAGYERAIAVALRQGARLWQLRATNDLSALWRAQGRAADVRARLAPLYSTFAGAVASADLRQAKALLAETA